MRRARAGRKNQAVLALGAAVMLLLTGACDDDDAAVDVPAGDSESTTTAAGGGGQPSADVTIAAVDIAFTEDQLTVPAGEEVTVTFENRDENIPHNFHVTAGSESFATEVEEGPTTQTLTFTIEDPGTYIYVCDVHPTMEGDLVVQ